MSVEVLSFGCRLNAAESEAMRRQAEAAGRTDLLLVNTCAVTAEAGRQARKAIRAAARANPAARVVVTGCGAQVETDAYAAMPEVAEIVGNRRKLDPATWTVPAPERVRIDDVMAPAPIRCPAATGDAGAHPRLPAGAERLRPPLHVLRHPVRARQLALGAGRRGRGAGPCAGGRRAPARWC